jgi:hypothetical protein
VLTADYDVIGRDYTATRREDPRLAAAIHAALGDARTVVNVGAGAGAYEPRDRDVTAVEPSAVMRSQRPAGAAPVVDARAEALPFADGSFDAAMAVLTDHHWQDRAGGLAELRRVACRRAVVFTFDARHVDDVWLLRDYLPQFATLYGLSLDDISAALGATHVETVPIPHDCADGFLHAYWRRPHAYLDAEVRAHISVFARVGEDAEAAFVAQLAQDLESGAWHERNAAISELEELDCGYRLLVAEIA